MKKLSNRRGPFDFDRRQLLHVGGLSALGIGVSDWLMARQAVAETQPARQTERTATAQSCILIWLDGGPSHLDLFDLKPNAPTEIRGPFSPIATNVSGIEICEQLPRTAQLMDKVALVRSVTSPLGEHNFASHYLLTGYKPTRALTYPGMPSVQKYLLPDGTAIPTNIAIAKPNAMIGSGYLPDSTMPFIVQGDPSRPDFRVKDLQLRDGMTGSRLIRRRQFRSAVDELARQSEEHLANSGSTDSAFDQAFRLVQSSAARTAFDLQQESQADRNRYGRHLVGQGCLMARRLVEAGAKFVTVTDRGWDTHEDIYLRLKEGFTGGTAGKIPKLDQAYSALLSDLSDRGLLDSTLVILMGEFGRTPKLNPRGGRDHWPGAFSVALAGGGTIGGQVIGRSDAHGERPAERPISPADLVRTIYRMIGIDGATELNTSDGRPVQVNRDGSVIGELIG
ncbi:hypothetical protein Mal15_33620 [Stieleria maiorica]|uniref:DUF1501 domain-containing protein n=1 Tax=Stieleria maiorica TaxID=2795974 RepID=A0A5B9MDY7_9BACT|nr:DUF1501 domain-containing protein [Stieleria maiorica]QEF99298.1 hypothetical protein Mal15_33620 [Stieleria maiorica]